MFTKIFMVYEHLNWEIKADKYKTSDSGTEEQ